ncbi:hypothetical protein C2S51_032046 [Perilla frutescens var. frutescens]|nr:hypothetical protein C2S51_032046 [Perilla frutescens var. frutescens]
MKEGDRRVPSSSSNRKVKKKWKSREERSRRIDKEYDVVLVPSDGVCLSGSESDDSDWSIGWLEPHAPDFQSDDEADDSFAVLVPCYRHDSKQVKEYEEEPTNPFFNAVRNLPLVRRHRLVFDVWKGEILNAVRSLLCDVVTSTMAPSTWRSGSPHSRIFEVTQHRSDVQVLLLQLPFLNLKRGGGAKLV